MDPAVDGGNPDENQTNQIKSEGLKFVFTSQRDNFPFSPCPYYDDGDPEMYTKENMEKRDKLRTNETVRAAINEFITKHFNPSKDGKYSKEEYMRVYMNIGMSLRHNIDAEDL